MRSIPSNRLCPISYNAVVEGLSDEVYTELLPAPITLLDHAARRPAHTWVSPFAFTPPGSVLKARVTMVSAMANKPAAWVVVDITPQPDLDVFPLVPEDYGESDGIVLRVVRRLLGREHLVRNVVNIQITRSWTPRSAPGSRSL